MTFAGALGVLQAQKPSARNLKALDKFFERSRRQLATCYDVDWPETSLSTDHQQNAAQQLASSRKIPLKAAKYAVATLGVPTEMWMDDCATFLIREEDALVKVVSQLFTLYEGGSEGSIDEELQKTVDKYVPDILEDRSFWPNVFSRAVGSPRLQELTYQALFSVIPDSSALISEWFNLASKKAQWFAGEPLGVLTTVQFLNVHQSWGVDSYARQPDTMKSIASAMEDAPPCIKLVWGLVLHHIALRSPSEALLTALDARDSVQFDMYARDFVQKSLQDHGHTQLVYILELLGTNVQYAQTVSDVLRSLLEVCKITPAFAKGLGKVLAPYAVLQTEFFSSSVVQQAWELTRAKVPAAIDAFVDMARILPIKDRLKSFESIPCFIDEVNTSDIEISDFDAVAKRDIVIFPPRPSDNEGAVVVDGGTRGKVISTAPAKTLVMWTFSYNGWSLLGRVVENADQKDDFESVMPIITLLTETFTSVIDAEPVVLALSSGLARGDFLELVMVRMENWMADFKHIDGVAELINFLKALIRHYPHRVQTFLERSSLMGGVGNGYVSDVIGSVEIFSTRFGFTLNFLEFISRILKDEGQLPKRMQAQITRYLGDVFESFQYWTYSIASQKQAILSSILGIFSRLQFGLRSCSPLISALESPNVKDVQVTLQYCAENNENTPELRKELYTQSKSLVNIFIRHPSLRPLVLQVLGILVAGGMVHEQAPSLLAYLGPKFSEILLKLLVSSVQDDLENDVVLIAICRLFTAVAASKQEGLLFLLKTREGLEGKKFSGLLPCLEATATKPDLSWELQAALLEAISAGQMAKKPGLDNVLLKMLENVPVDINDDSCWQLRSTAHAVDILRSHFPEKLRTADILENTRKFISIKNFDSKLYDRTHKAIMIKYRARLTDFIHDEVYGEHYPYDISKLNASFHQDPYWPRYRADIMSLNANLSCVAAQTELLESWRKWCVSLAAAHPQTPNLDKCALLALDRLQANVDLTNLFFRRLLEMRTNMAFVMIFYTKKASIEVVDAALQLLADPLVGIQANADAAQGIRVYCDVLKILSFQLSLFGRSNEPRLSQILLSTLDLVVIRPVQVIASLALDPDRTKSASQDLEEIIAILHHALRLLGHDSLIMSPLGQVMAETCSDRYMSRLYSYALDIDPHGGLGELALLYIHEWLPVGIMADHFVSNGLLTVLVESPMSRRIQKGGVIPAAEKHVHSTWCHGLLSILLELLKQLGTRIVEEAWLFLDSFRLQIRTCVEQWSSQTGQISLALIEETLLLHALLSLIASLAPEELNGNIQELFNRDELLRAIDHLSSHRKYLTTRMSPSDDQECIIQEMSDLRELMQQR